MPIAMMGAPTVLCEKGTGGGEYKDIYDMVSQYLGKQVYAVMPMEAGGVNSMLPIAAAARLGLPMVDCDGMGRAFPELQMVTFTIGGVSATPMALTDEKGNSVIFNTITNKWTEELARAVTMSCGGSVTVSLYVMDGRTMKAFGVKDIVTRSEMLGRAIREVKNHPDKTPERAFLDAAEGYGIFKGKIADVLRETNGKFNLGRVQLEGIGECRGHRAEVCFQNETSTPPWTAKSSRPCPTSSAWWTRTPSSRHHRGAQIRQARAGGGPQVLRDVAQRGRSRARLPEILL